MRILQVTTELRLAGAELVILNLSKCLIDKGHQVTVVCLQPLPSDDQRSIVKELESYGIQVFSLKVTKEHPWRLFRLGKIIKTIKPDIVHSHLIHANLTSRLNRLLTPFPLVNSIHIAEKRQNKQWHFWLDRLSKSLCGCQTAVSKAVSNFHAPRIGETPQSIPVVYNGIHFPQQLTAKDKENLLQEWGVVGCNKIIGSVGRLDQQKGYDIFLEQLFSLSNVIPLDEKWGIVILGEGAERAKLEQIIAGTPANITVKMPGFRKDAATCIAAFDLFVMPSRYEGFGLTLIEAMSHGVPILAAAVDSLPELMSFYSNGTCIDFNDTAQLTEKISTFIAKAPSHFDNPFSVEKMTKGYLEVYEKVLTK